MNSDPNGFRSRKPHSIGRALDLCLAIPGIQPTRCLSMLYPLWEVEVLAEVESKEEYEVFDQYVERAISEAGVTTAEGISAFFRIEPPLVLRVLRFLQAIGHVVLMDGHYRLTELGARSQREAIRYTVKETRQNLLFDALSLTPLTREHQAGEIRTFDRRAVLAENEDLRYFQLLTAGVLNGRVAFDPAALRALENLPERDEHNLPRTLRNLRLVKAWEVYLPLHLVETVTDRGDTRLLAISQLPGGPDDLLSRLCDSQTEVRNLFNSEPEADPEDVLVSWLDRQGLPTTDVLTQLPNGVWRATLPEDMFNSNSLRPTRIGRFQQTKGRFMQIWCDKLAQRRLAALERGLWLIQSRLKRLDDLQAGLDRLTEQLEIDRLTVSDLKDHAVATGKVKETLRIDSLS
ncbi:MULTISPECIES: hypothetical protein [unclassified Crossiella]|uniref:hypothetical protein n=1 Tax=unclassified Crossiella TaxID=2620835 RepID=UPI001FFE547E|nr:MULTISPECIES: hypothetical protein [unclassified Crossiella]MCK2239569.1 hypothetical protein [Crossiella sp. S99.2]MCK2252264.1 hypothetical protein [Crossiella sp. S99.1]